MNKDSQLYQVLVRIENGIKRMNEQAAAVRWYLEADDIETAYDKALKLEAVTEKTTCSRGCFRHIPDTREETKWLKKSLWIPFLLK